MTPESGSTDVKDPPLLTPLIKEELKWTIKCRRHSQRKEEISIDLSPPVQMAPSAEDLAVKKERQTRNNDAARKYRRKLRLKQMRVEKERDKQMELNRKLKKVIQQVWHQRGELLLLLQQHVRVCKVGPLLQKSKQFLQQVYQDMAKVDKTVESCVGLNLVEDQLCNGFVSTSVTSENVREDYARWTNQGIAGGRAWRDVDCYTSLSSPRAISSALTPTSSPPDHITSLQVEYSPEASITPEHESWPMLVGGILHGSPQVVPMAPLTPPVTPTVAQSSAWLYLPSNQATPSVELNSQFSASNSTTLSNKETPPVCPSSFPANGPATTASLATLSMNSASSFTTSLSTSVANQATSPMNPASPLTDRIPTTMADQPMPWVNPASPFTESIPTTMANQSMPSVNPASPFTESIPITMANQPMPSVNPVSQFTGIIPTTANQPMPSMNPASPFTESIPTTIANQPMPSVNPASPFIANITITTANQPMPSVNTASSFTENIPTTMANQPMPSMNPASSFTGNIPITVTRQSTAPVVFQQHTPQYIVL